MGVGSRLRGLLANLLLVCLSLVFTILALEVGLRIFWDGFYLKDEDPYAARSATRTWQNLPNNVARRGEPEFVFVASTDGLGHRRNPRTVGRDSVEKRVFVLGDSFTYGIGVQDDETFCARVEQLDPRLELINGGVNGYGTAQQLLMLREEGHEVQPHAVLIAFFWNDVGNSYNRPHPRFRLVDGELITPEPQSVPEPGANASERRKYRRHSHAYRFLSDRLKMAGYWSRVMLGLPLAGSDFVSEPDRQEAWVLWRALVAEIRDEASRLGAVTILTMIPDQVQIESDVELVGFDPADYDVEDRVRGVARELDIPFVDLLPALEAEVDTNGAPLYYRKDRHLTVRGNEVVARKLQSALDELLF